MKIFGIGANYQPEGETRLPGEDLMIFPKQPTSLHSGNTFTYPSFSDHVVYELEVVIKINQTLKDATPQQALESFDEVALGIDWTAKDEQRKAKEKGWPWTFAKGFDQAAFIGEWLPRGEFEDIQKVDLVFKVNGEVKQSGNTGRMISSFEHTLTYISKYITLTPGDLIYTGTVPTPGPIQKGDHCEGWIGETQYLDFKVV